MLDFTMSTSTSMSVFGASCDLLSAPVGGPSTADTMGVVRTPGSTLGTAVLAETGETSAVELLSLPAEIGSLLSTALDAVGVIELVKLLASVVDDVFNGEFKEATGGLACTEWGLMVGIEEDEPRGGGPDGPGKSAGASPTDGWTSEEAYLLLGLSTADD